MKQDQVVDLPACPYCGITDRDEYRLVSCQAYRGTFQGRNYTHIVRRRTKCKSCRKTRIDRFYENQITTSRPGEVNEPARVQSQI